MSNILIFGDSITRGAFDLEKHGWASRLSMFCWKNNFQKTGVYYRGPDIDIFAIDGDRTVEVVKKFDFQIENYQWSVDKIVFAIGTNDAGFEKGEKRNNKKDFEKNLEILVQKGVEKVGVENVYFLGLTDIDSEIIKEDWEENRLKEFDKIIQKVVEENDCQFIPMQGLLKKEDLADGLHPNAQGHEKIFQRVKEYLKLEK